MRVFLAGASGAIGRPLVPKLIEAGHRVTGMTRSERAAKRLRAAGAAAVVADVFDEPRVRNAMAEAGPEVVVHELTALPKRYDPRKSSVFEPTNRLRTEGTRILIETARAAGARRVVAQSVAFQYVPIGGWVKSEDDAVLEDAPGHWGESARASRELERTVLGAEGLKGLVLRYGYFYGPGTYFARDGSTAFDVRRRRQPIVGRGKGVFSFVHVEDAADATVAAVERGGPGVYNVVDDDPAPLRDWLPVYAEALGAPRPLRVPKLLARLLAGRALVSIATEARGASNQRAKRELGWQPRHPTWRRGFPQSLR
ncbi:MAG: NAD-dependent epimerase/dehydratase family protein [Thermoleophilaceae bacterium]